MIVLDSSLICFLFPFCRGLIFGVERPHEENPLESKSTLEAPPVNERQRRRSGAGEEKDSASISGGPSITESQGESGRAGQTEGSVAVISGSGYGVGAFAAFPPGTLTAEQSALLAANKLDWINPVASPSPPSATVSSSSASAASHCFSAGEWKVDPYNGILQPGEKCTIRIVLTPSAPTHYLLPLTLYLDDDPDKPYFQFLAMVRARFS